MAQDIRELFRNDKSLPKGELPKGHQARFEARLASLNGVSQEHDGVVEMTSSKLRFNWMKYAAILLVALSVGILGYNQLGQTAGEANVVTLDKVETNNTNNDVIPVYLSDLSPQFKEVEDYYLASINMEIAQLQVNDENKELINAFMTQLAELDEEYVQLNRELKEAGVNEQTVNTLIANLQLRLELLFKLKSKLNQLKQNQNENIQDARA